MAHTWRVRSPRAEALWLCLFAGETETRHAMAREGDDWVLTLPGDHAGVAYGYRAEGRWAPDEGLWFDPAKLLVDPRAVELDRRFAFDPALAIYGADTAALVPRAIVPAHLPEVPQQPPAFTAGGLIYEVNVRAFTLLHPDVPKAQRGTVAALAHPAVLAHLKKLHVAAVELMPIVAWLDERHLPPLGLTNAWGYNPVAFMALDPGLCPGGMAELRETVATLRRHGIGTLLDLVFNHTGESEEIGPIVSLRGLDNAAYAHTPEGRLVNHTGCGNTLDFAQASVRALTLDTLRHFVRHAGVDGFRFDLAPVLARGPDYAADAPIFAEIAADPWLADRVMIAEPWDIGPGGYRLGEFPAGWLEWNDLFRDDARRFWGEQGTPAMLATRLAGSADVFGPCADRDCRSVNFIAAHDGFTLADLVSYTAKHNEANGEANRDGHNDNHSWNCGVEGPSDDPDVLARRATAQRALLGTLFASTGTIMLTAGDEFGRTQQGNNNAYCQDNAIGWIDWAARDRDLEDHVAMLAAVRAVRQSAMARFPEDGTWTAPDGHMMEAAEWNDPAAPGLTWAPARASDRAGFEIDREDGVTLR